MRGWAARMNAAATVSVGLALTLSLLTACGGPAASAGTSDAGITAPVITPSTPAESTGGATHTLPPTALALAKAMRSAGLPLGSITKQTPSTDPTKLLGKPKGYAERVSFDYPGGDTQADPYLVARGGVIERWDSHDRAESRKTYLAASLRADPSRGTEYDYILGDLLIRLSGDLKSSTALKVQNVLNSLA